MEHGRVLVCPYCSDAWGATEDFGWFGDEVGVLCPDCTEDLPGTDDADMLDAHLHAGQIDWWS